MKYIPPLNALPGDEEDEDRSHWNADPSGVNSALRSGAFPSAIGFEACQREIVHVIGEAELEPDPEDYTQLYQAIAALIAAAVPEEPELDTSWQLPIGSTYENYDDDTNPATLLGYGTWVAMQDRMKIGAGGTYAPGATGGSVTTTQNSSQLANHYHTATMYTSDTGGDIHPGGANSGATTSFNTSSAGSGAPMTTISPYIAVYMWRRVA